MVSMAVHVNGTSNPDYLDSSPEDNEELDDEKSETISVEPSSPMVPLKITIYDDSEKDSISLPDSLPIYPNGWDKKIFAESGDPKPKKLDGLGKVFSKKKILARLRGTEPKVEKKRIVLNEFGVPIRPKRADGLPLCRISEVRQRVALADSQDGIDLPVLHNMPSEVEDVRRMIRSKMIRCKRCKNRFVEKNLYERHLRDRHHDDYVIYIAEQEAEMEQQRQEEIEANRIEELQTGGFIPPESEIDVDIFDVNVDVIPLPGENNGGVVPRFDSFGRLKSVKRPYKRKISPQCPFCDKRFRNEYSLKKHFVKKHPELLEFDQCLKCFKCLNIDEMETHNCELTYICFECTPIRNLCTDVRLLNHRKKFHRGANSGFRCSFCNLKFLTPRKLRKHKKMSHVFTKTYQCHFCEEIFISEVAVMTHERVHTGIIKFECKVCDYKANRFTQMEDHARDEHGYVCAICQEKLSEWCELKHHTLVKHGGYLSADHPTGHIESPRLWILYKGE
ncbi:unnamed protein product [Caenorhabditis auriculariae]|uniref:C2H2-type domain-containing protein n=1 Tax=Caenorhabditis auriculariae TaxID=2777116 RepID=A0A8S1HIK4_9PELO|nr:unnamed protein product [Caenorhabditis auriculariae]